MFPLQQSDDNELVFQILSNPSQQGNISQDLILDYASLETSHPQNVKNPKKKKLPRRVLGSRSNSDKKDSITDEFKLKKVMHRDMERQRRQEMTNLYSSLRSLLPLQCVKGKRSVSDHMHEAVNYIKQLQANMNKLERKREKLKMVPKSSPRGRVEEDSSDVSSIIASPDCDTVSPCHGGVEILINGNNNRGESLPLSRILQELLKEGLDVVSCVSAKVNQNSLHRIQSEGCDEKCINLHSLQRKVIDVINIDV
ncbi:transcription factor bHLH118 [Nicotiana tabacum]|uniref:Transcription factor bHLH118 n=1 Tax=Nicotiana tabacum TaxID=4097 RepID=A0A1S4AYZ3_TOBAC|nr:PREDICTED: transcription factor bHLH118-like [Nicotiana tabacum]